MVGVDADQFTVREFMFGVAGRASWCRVGVEHAVDVDEGQWPCGDHGVLRCLPWDSVAAFARLARPDIPVVNASRNQGHWHHIRSGDGRLRRVHLDLGEWSWRMDPVEELAASVLTIVLARV